MIRLTDPESISLYVVVVESCATANPTAQVVFLLFSAGLIKTGHVFPVDVAHESIDVGRRLGAIVDMIRMLVHIERQNWGRASETVGMIGCPLVDEFFVSL